jgi:Spy/CpxP family protein refolding chaperone
MKFKTLRVMAAAALLATSVPVLSHANSGGDMDEMEEKMDRAIDKVEVSGEKRERLREARREHKEVVQPIHERMEQHMNTLKEQVDRKAGDSELKETLDKLEDDKEDLMQERKKFHEKLEDILTPTQKAKMVLSMKGKMRRATDMK